MLLGAPTGPQYIVSFAINTTSWRRAAGYRGGRRAGTRPLYKTLGYLSTVSLHRSKTRRIPPYCSASTLALRPLLCHAQASTR
jgi:hypothetical protein